MISVMTGRCMYSYYVAGLPWDAAYVKHMDEFRAEYGLPPLGAAGAVTRAATTQPKA